MNCSNDVWETAFQTTSIGEKQINVILSLLHNFIQLLVVDWKIILEHSNGLLARVYKCYADLVKEVNFGDQHSGKYWTQKP